MEYILEDLNTFEKEYSQLRNFDKWRYFRDSHGNFFELNLKCQFVKVVKEFSVDYFLVACLLKRRALKNSEEIKLKIKQLWSTINPAKLPQIAKSVHFSLLKFLYSQFMTITSQNFESWLKHDLDLDIPSKTFLNFSSFSSSIFDVVDSLSGSKMQSEYLKILEDCKKSLETNEIFLKTSQKVNISIYVNKKAKSGNLITELSEDFPSQDRKIPSQKLKMPKNIQKIFDTWTLKKLLNTRKNLFNRDLSPKNLCAKCAGSKNIHNLSKKVDFLSPISKTPLRDRRDKLKARTPDILTSLNNYSYH
jgi:hypothetical protein